MKSILNYIDGQFVRGKRGFADVNPADGSVIAQVSEADQGLVDDAAREVKIPTLSQRARERSDHPRFLFRGRVQVFEGRACL